MQIESPHRLLKEKHRQERAELILQAAEAVLMEQGYHDTSMDEIAARAGVAKGTVYLHFPSKEDLVFALLERKVEMFQQEVEQILASSVTARSKLENILLRAFQGPLGQHSQVFMALVTNADVRKRLMEKHAQMRERIEHLAALIRAVLEEGKAAGEFDPTISTALMVATFMSFLGPMSRERLMASEQLTPEQLVAQITRIYFQGIVCKLQTQTGA